MTYISRYNRFNTNVCQYLGYFYEKKIKTSIYENVDTYITVIK